MYEILPSTTVPSTASVKYNCVSQACSQSDRKKSLGYGIKDAWLKV